ncbi:MAG: hypothetical protein E6Q98_16135 [Rhodospirillaceae bacterium]|nr:MAG: hypothetical protein E6Q98_16135 [Rhodospirillaceae bacterium]
MPKVLKPANTFHISFDTKSVGPAFIKTVKVTIEEDVMDQDDAVRIDLADHPLYPALQAYVRSNPR